MSQVPIAEGILTWPSAAPRLLASRCRRCDARSFPVQSGCPRCGWEDLETIELSPGGKLWTCTSQEFRRDVTPCDAPIMTSISIQRQTAGTACSGIAPTTTTATIVRAWGRVARFNLGSAGCNMMH
jgi:ribosomal protein L40E